jgi:rhomboid family GlyGly-CTERM serine protease
MNRSGACFRLNSLRYLPLASLLISAVAVLVVLFPSLADRLQYDRTAIQTGELWRIVTCHLTHWSLDHLFWDAVALLVLGFLVERDHRKTFYVCIGASAVLIPTSIWFCLPELETYRGLSGIDSAVFLLLAVIILQEYLTAREWAWTVIAVVVLGGFVAKIAFEIVTGSTFFVDSDAAKMLPVPLAHVVGGILGAVCGLRLRDQSPRPSRTLN